MSERGIDTKKEKWQDLREYTKDDLMDICLILAKRIDPSDPMYAVQCALLDFNLEEQMKLIAEQDRLSEIAYKARLQVNEIMSPYKGIPQKDIPDDTWKRAVELTNAANSADAERYRLSQKIEQEYQGLYPLRERKAVKWDEE